MKNKRYRMLVAIVAFIGFVSLPSLDRSNQPVAVPDEYAFVLSRRED